MKFIGLGEINCQEHKGRDVDWDRFVELTNRVNHFISHLPAYEYDILLDGVNDIERLAVEKCASDMIGYQILKHFRRMENKNGIKHSRDL